MTDNRTMAELLQAPTEGYEDAIVILEIAANNFELKHGLINLVQNKQFFGHDKEDPHAHIRYFNKILYDEGPTRFIELRYGWKPFGQNASRMHENHREQVHSSLITSQGSRCQNKKNQSSAPAQSSTPAPVKAVEPNYVTCGGLGTLPSNIITNPKEDLNGITTRSGVAYQGPTIPTSSKVVKQGTEATKDQVQTPSSQSTALTGRALIDVHKGELTLHIRNEAISYNLDQTVRYSANYNQITANKIDVICEEYSQEVLGFFDVTANGNPTPYDDPIVSTTSPTLTPLGDSNFLLFEEADTFLGLDDDPNSPKINPFYYDPEGEILLLEAILNSKPLPPLPNHEQYMPSFKKELKVCEAKTVKSSVDEPPEGINSEFCTHKILMEEDYKPAVQHQRRVNPKIHDIINKEVEKLLDPGLIYPISDSPWVSLVHCVPKKGGFNVVENEENELIPTRLVTGWRVCLDYQKLNEATCKDHFPLLFMDQMLERSARNEYYCFLDGFSRCMLAIFHDMVEKTMEVFMDDFSVFGNSFENCLARLDKMLQRCEDTNLCLNWEKSHFMVKEGIVLSHKIYKNGIEVDKAKVDVIAKLPYPTTVKDCIKAFQMLKKKLTEAPILIAPNWDLPFELTCDASDFAIGAVLGQRHEKHFKPIHYASKTMTDAESNYTTTEKEMLAVVMTRRDFSGGFYYSKNLISKFLQRKEPRT
nr:DNA-directed DNA polymerase [Tanacetum cinerariifolium]